MLSCCCTLAGSQACYSCPNYLAVFGTIKPVINIPNGPLPAFNKKKIIREIYEDGKLKERIIEE